jgi:hypothetical protein
MEARSVLLEQRMDTLARHTALLTKSRRLKVYANKRVNNAEYCA